MAAWSLSIGSIQAAASPVNGVFGNSLIWPVRLARNYDGPSSLTVLVRGDPRGRSIQAGAPVRLRLDGDTVFLGRAGLPRITASAREAGAIEYEALDYSSINLGPRVKDGHGNTSFSSGYGRLGDAAQQLAALTGQSVGFEAGADDVPVYPQQFDNESIDSAFRKLAAAAPGVRLMYSASEKKYVFVQIFRSSLLTISVASEFISEVDIITTVEGCCGAVATQSREVNYDTTQWRWVPLSGAWSASDAENFTLDKSFSLTAPDGLEPGASKAFRRWSFGTSFLPGLQPTQNSQFQVIWEASSGVWKLATIAAIDIGAGILSTVEPLFAAVKPHKVARRNPNIPGQVTAASARLRYTIGGAGTGTIPGTRYPGSGFSGRAYTLDPERCGFELPIDVPSLPQGSFNHAKYARAAWEVYSEPIVRGGVTIAGDPPAAIFALNRRINIASTQGELTGFENLGAPLMGFEMSFDPAGLSTRLDFSTERSLVLAGGQA